MNTLITLWKDLTGTGCFIRAATDGKAVKDSYRRAYIIARNQVRYLGTSVYTDPEDAYEDPLREACFPTLETTCAIFASSFLTTIRMAAQLAMNVVLTSFLFLLFYYKPAIFMKF